MTRACYLETKKEYTVRVKNEEYRTREHLYLHELEDLLLAARNKKGKNAHRDYTLILIIARHGLRVVEASWLRWESINLVGGTITIKRAKGSQDGTHPLKDDEIEALVRLKESQAPGTKEVFGLKSKSISKLIERTGEKANLDIKVHAHMLRHTCGYLLINNGYNSRTVQDYLGHRQFSMTEKYTRMAPNAYDNIDWDSMKG